MSFNRPMKRREALGWIAGLSAIAGIGACGAGGIASFLLLRRAALERPYYTQTLPVATLQPTATPAPPPIVSRETWGARPVNHEAQDEKGFASAANPNGWLVYEGDLRQIYRTVGIHHSSPIRGDTGTMRDIQNLHQDTRKWADIGYHYGVGRDGTIYAGRDINVRGSNIAGYNTGTAGIVAIGDFQYETPTQAQLASILALVNWLKAAYGITHLAGHSDFNPTTICPGPNMKPYLDILAQAAQLTRGTGGYVPPATPPSGDTRESRLMSGSSCC